jgi:hypothetical protein
MSNRAVTIVLLHCGSKFNSALDRGGQAARISAAERLEDLSRAEDDEGRHTEGGEISFI